jgi:hypothetical protein
VRSIIRPNRGQMRDAGLFESLAHRSERRPDAAGRRQGRAVFRPYRK